MKNIVRVSAAALIFAGIFSANTRHANAATRNVAMNSAIPVPTCPPTGNNTCGLELLGQ